MSNKKRTIIIIAIILGALIASLLINLFITLIQDVTRPIKYEEFVQKYAAQYNIPEYIIYAVINEDSDFDQNKQYTDGAKGLMHITQKTFARLASVEHLNDESLFDDITSPDISIRFGAYYLRYLFNTYRNWDTAIVAYFVGESEVNTWLKDKQYSKNGVNLKEIPLDEAEDYLDNVNDSIDYYKDTYYKNGVFVK